jgi:hypothetical protein
MRLISSDIEDTSQLHPLIETTTLSVPFVRSVEASDIMWLEAFKNYPSKSDFYDLVDESDTEGVLKAAVFTANLGGGKVLTIKDSSYNAPVPVVDLSKGPLMTKGDDGEVYVHTPVVGKAEKIQAVDNRANFIPTLKQLQAYIKAIEQLTAVESKLDYNNPKVNLPRKAMSVIAALKPKAGHKELAELVDSVSKCILKRKFDPSVDIQIDFDKVYETDLTPYVRKQRKRAVNKDRLDAQQKLAKKAESQNKAISDSKKPAELKKVGSDSEELIE